MPRNAWAKVYCDILRHPKIIGRPDSDVRLFLGLILYAKEFAPDSGLVALGAAAMRQTFGIKAPLRVVEAGIAYFVDQGVLVREGTFVRIRDFAERQKATHDSPEAVRERQRRWRERNGGVTGDAHRDATPAVTASVTGTRLTREVEGEEEILDRKLVARGGGTGEENSQPVNLGITPLNLPESLSQSDHLQVQRLLREGKAQEAQALLAGAASKHKRSEPEDNSRPTEATP